MVRRWSAQFSFWSGQRVGQTLVKLGQTPGNVFWAPSRGSFDVVSPCRVRMAWSNFGQTWSTLVKLGQNWPNLPEPREMCSELYPKAFLMWWTPVESDWLGSGCLVLRADTRENSGGKNRVMTVAPSLFGVSWHKERRTKNK